MISITLDTDWVPEGVLEYVLNILHSKKVKATIFASGQYDCLHDVDDKIIEIGLHPNFEKLDDAEKTLRDLQSIYPKAVCLRPHSLVHSSRFWQMYKENNIKYTSIFFMPYQPQLAPVTMPYKILEFPIFFMDDYYLVNSKNSFGIEDLKLETHGLKVFAFHPIYLYLNSDSILNYNNAKSYLDKPDLLKKYRNPGKGITNLFDSLIEYILSNKINLYTLRDIAEKV